MTSPTELKDQQRREWSAAASGWDAWDDWLDKLSQPISDWMAEAAGVAPGMQVLDLACGTGQPTVTLARRVQPSGQVTATDLAREMLEVAERKARAKGASNVHFKEMDIERLEFEDDAFDAATCRWGLMFCPDLHTAVQSVHRVLRPGSRFAAVTWASPAENPYFSVLMQVLPRFVPPSAPPDPKAPGPFRLSDPDEVQDLLEQAGFRNVHVDSMSLTMPFESLEEYWDCTTQIAAPLKAALARMDEATIAELKRAAFEAVSQFSRGERLAFPGRYIAASAQK